MTTRTVAQFENTWSEPVNLSHSGSTTDPQIVIDSAGRYHVVWLDDFEGYVYTGSTDGLNLSAPVTVEFPFTEDDSSPLLLSDLNGNIHAFWKNEDNALLYSSTSVNNNSIASGWASPITLAESALDVDAVVDSQGILHMAYVRNVSSEASPAGIYYTRSTDNGLNWSANYPIYLSQYFRSLDTTSAHVQLSASPGENDRNVYLAWDNRPIKRVFISQSNDAGVSWTSAVEMDGPTSDNITSDPFNILVYPVGKDVLLLWQAGSAKRVRLYPILSLVE